MVLLSLAMLSLAMLSLATLVTAASDVPLPGVMDSPAPRASVAPSGGRQWVVAKGGRDAASGTARRPFRSIARALRSVRPGDTVLVRPGRYRGFDITVAGEANAPITIQGSTPGEVIIDGRLGGRRDTIDIWSSAAYIDLAGLTITGSSGSRSAGILVSGVTRGPISIRDSRLTENSGYGILVEDSRDISIVRVELDHDETGVEIDRDGAGVVISDSLIHDNDRLIRSTPRLVDSNDDTGASGVSLVRTTGPIVVERNRIWADRAPSSDYGWDGSAFEIFAASGVTIQDNIAWDNENVLETGTDGSAPCAGNTFARNVAWGAATAGRARGIILRCGSGMLLANDTLVDLDDYALMMGTDSGIFSGSIDGARVVNVLLVEFDQGVPVLISDPLPADVSIDHVLVWSDVGAIAQLPGPRPIGSLSALQGMTGQFTASLSVPPRFVDRAAHDFRLLAGSPAIDSGTDVPGVTDAWDGPTPDMGAYEMALPSPTASP